MMLVPLVSMAQSNWERPEAQKAEKVTKAKTSKQSKSKESDLPYLAGAVPEVDGKIVYTLDLDIPGKSAAQIYDMAYAQLDKLAKDEKQTGDSKIAIVNKDEHSIVATYEEWLVFSDKILMLDRAQMGYIIVVKCSDGKMHMTIERINYKYDLQRNPEYWKAEEIISDKEILSKDGTKLKKGYVKFRKKTVDRMNEIMNTIREGMK